MWARQMLEAGAYHGWSHHALRWDLEGGTLHIQAKISKSRHFINFKPEI